MLSTSSQGTPGIIGIRREDNIKWERRAPITPQHVAKLLQDHPHLKFIVQPSPKRIFRDSEYVRAGATISEDLSECSTIFGVKKMKPSNLLPNRTYVFFSHVIKAQEYNMPRLDYILQNNIRLVDYEMITDEEGKRLVDFGTFGGNAGVLDFLHGLGKYFLNLGYSTPFLNMSCSYSYKTLDKAKTIIKDLAEAISNEGIPKKYAPFIFAINGKGRCARGVMEILECLPITVVDPDQLVEIVNDKENPKHLSTIYVTFLETHHIVKPLDSNKAFSKEDYYALPDTYTPIFHEKYLPYISVLFNCIYWDHKYQKLITKEQIKTLAESKNLRIFGICDISCDVRGSIDFLKSFTTLDEPFFLYNPLTNECSKDFTKSSNDILYLAVEHLPTELPYDASVFFSEKLVSFVENIAMSDMNAPFEEQGLVLPIKRAVIAWNGKLTDAYEYITQLKQVNEDLKRKRMFCKNAPEDKPYSFVSIRLKGHLFDTNAINLVFDYLEENNIKFNVLEMEMGQNAEESSSAYIQLFTINKEGFDKALDFLYGIAGKHKISIQGK